jgi:hypothetical protein
MPTAASRGLNLGRHESDTSIVELGYNCLRNYPEAYMLGDPPIPDVEPVLPVDDVRTGEFLLFLENDPTVYRGRVEVAIDELGTGVTDLREAYLVFPAEGTQLLILNADAIFSDRADGTGSVVTTRIALGNAGTDNLVNIDLTVACMQPDVDINPSSARAIPWRPQCATRSRWGRTVRRWLRRPRSPGLAVLAPVPRSSRGSRKRPLRFPAGCVSSTA